MTQRSLNSIPIIALRGLRVCFVAGTLGQGGAERQLYYMLKSLVEAGAQVRLLSLTQGEFYQEPIQKLGVSVIWIGQSGNKLVRLARLMRELKRSPVDILQSQHFHANVYVALAGRCLRIPHLGAMRSTGSNEVAMTGRLLGPWCLRWPKAIAANSQVAIQYATAQGISSARLHHLPNALDTSVFHPVDRPERTPVRVVAVGRLGPEKRFDRFLRTLAAVRRMGQMSLEGVLVGNGPLRAELEAKCDELGLRGSVQFLGAVSDMMTVYPRADVLMLTSDWEGTPNVLLEAMATGLPVLATCVGGVPQVVRDNSTGFLVDVADEDRLAVRLRELVESHVLRARMGAAGIQFVEQHYSLASLPTALAALYEKVRA